MTEREHASLDPFVDWPELFARVGGDRELLQELFELFQEEFPRMRDDLHRAVECGDVAEIQHAAHAMKGMLFSLSCKRGGALAADIEDAARAGDSRKIHEANAMFGRESAQYLPALEIFMAGRKP
jgi:two-component system, sensor histidine kinase and response regulator